MFSSHAHQSQETPIILAIKINWFSVLFASQLLHSHSQLHQFVPFLLVRLHVSLTAQDLTRFTLLGHLSVTKLTVTLIGSWVYILISQNIMFCILDLNPRCYLSLSQPDLIYQAGKDDTLFAFGLSRKDLTAIWTNKGCGFITTFPVIFQTVTTKWVATWESKWLLEQFYTDSTCELFQTNINSRRRGSRRR